MGCSLRDLFPRHIKEELLNEGFLFSIIFKVILLLFEVTHNNCINLSITMRIFILRHSANMQHDVAFNKHNGEVTERFSTQEQLVTYVPTTYLFHQVYYLYYGIFHLTECQVNYNVNVWFTFKLITLHFINQFCMQFH